MAQKRNGGSAADPKPDAGTAGGNGSFADIDGISFIEPVGAGGTGDVGTGDSRSDRAKRAWNTRRANSGAGAKEAGGKKEAAPSKILKGDDLVQPIMIFHMIAANKFPEMAVSEEEAKELSEAICNYLRHSNTVVSQKTKDLMVLVYAFAMIEGTRLIAVVNRKRHEAEMQKNSRKGAVPNVVAFDPATGQVR